jgi:hypothetical protein
MQVSIPDFLKTKAASPSRILLRIDSFPALTSRHQVENDLAVFGNVNTTSN